MPVAELNDLVIAALKRAMRVKGIEGNASAFTRLLKDEVGDAPDPSTVGRWLRGEQTAPAWALVAASRASGISPSDLLLPEADTAELKGLVESLQAQLTELRALWAGAGRPSEDQAGAAFEGRLAQLADVIARLQDSVETQGELLDRLARQVLPRGRRDEARDAPAADRAGPARERG